MDTKQTMRDAFWDRVYDQAKNDRNVFIVSADMGAPSLDKFRRDMPAQYIYTGIAEQNTILVSAGLAMKGKKVYAYAIAPFITMRCYEQIRLYCAGMNLPISVVGVGAGCGYEDSGPTHHSVEDITILRGLPNMRILSPSDNHMVRKIADMAYEKKGPEYIRLDRQPFGDIYNVDTQFDKGFFVLRPVRKLTLVATGCMVHTALAVADKLMEKGIEVGVLDVYQIPIHSQEFVDTLSKANVLYTIEEQTLPGGFSSYMCELMMDHGLQSMVHRIGFDFSKGYCYTYGGRTNIWKDYAMDAESIYARIVKENI